MNRHSETMLWMLAGAGVVAAMAVSLSVPAIGQHLHDPNDPGHWYDPECCSLRDCAPVQDVNVEQVQGGYQVEIRPGQHPMVGLGVSEFVEHGDQRIRVSQDADYHACVISGASFMDANGAPTSDNLLCLYVPLMGA